MIFTFKKHNSNFSKSKRSKFVMLLIILWLVSIFSTFLIVWNKQQDHTDQLEYLIATLKYISHQAAQCLFHRLEILWESISSA